MNNKLVPTHRYKTTILFYDDRNSFLSLIKNRLVSHKYEFKYVDNLVDFQACIAKSAEAKAKLPDVLSKLDNELTDFAHNEVFNFDLSKLKAIRNLPNKYDEISVVFVDNDLGDHNGIEICSKLPSDFKKILLTGKCDKDEAIKALNDKAINLYIDKLDLDSDDFNLNLNQFSSNHLKDETETLINKILAQIENFSDLYFIESNFYNNHLLSSPIFKKLFNSVLNQFDIEEYCLFEKDTFLLIDKQQRELLFKYWQDDDFTNYYHMNFDELDSSNTLKLKNAMANKQIPINQNFIDSIKFENFYYSFCRI
ncbi:MAG: hypothetical protein KBD37_01580 [Burkholderiales bacterium]|nr:hypothetical protein [Burkholderiales bacterium]